MDLTQVKLCCICIVTSSVGEKCRGRQDEVLLSVIGVWLVRGWLRMSEMR